MPHPVPVLARHASPVPVPLFSAVQVCILKLSLVRGILNDRFSRISKASKGLQCFKKSQGYQVILRILRTIIIIIQKFTGFPMILRTSRISDGAMDLQCFSTVRRAPKASTDLQRFDRSDNEKSDPQWNPFETYEE